MFEEARRLGADIQFDRHVVHVDCQSPLAKLVDGTTIEADVVIGADGESTLIIVRAEVD